MINKEINIEIKKFLEKINPEITISDEDNLFDLGILDSLHLAHLLSFVENRYIIKITPFELTTANFKTIREISNFVKNKQEK